MGKRLIDAGRRALQLETYLQLTGNREIYLENCRRILEYNDIRIVVQTAELVLEIWGSDLQADSRSPESLVITLTPKGVRQGTASAE